MGGGVGRPNLQDYEHVYRHFSWDQAYRELGLNGSKFNLAYEATDGQVGRGRGPKVAFYFHGPGWEVQYTYAQLAELSNRLAAFFQKIGVAAGERIFIYLPPGPETYLALLGAVKRGAIACPLDYQWPAGFVEEILRDSQPSVLITSAKFIHRIKLQDIPLKAVILAEEAWPGLAGDVVSRTYSWREALACAAHPTATLWLDKEAPMLLMYTSGSTGRPKGVVHVHGGIVQYQKTGWWVLDLHEDDIYWCTADPSWITGISYGVWAPLLNGATSVIYTGPASPAEWYEIIERYRVSVWYTTPNDFRQLMTAGTRFQGSYDLTSLRHLLSVGEPLNPAVIRWAQQNFGLKIYDTWWMTETGGQVLANFPCLPVKPGSMGKPCPGLYVSIIDDEGRELPPLEIGHLAIRAGWPAMMRQIWGDAEKYQDYFRLAPWYLSGDLAYRDKEGYFWFQGRTDDIIKSNGRRLGPFEIESVLVQHPAVLEAGVIGRPDVLKGEAIKAFVALTEAYFWNKELEGELREFAAQRLPAYAVPDEIEVWSELPKTINGKILRRVLKAWEVGLSLDDTYPLDE